MKRSPLGTGAKSIERGTTFAAKRKPLAPVSPRKANASGQRRRSTLNHGNGFAASPAQRDRVRDHACIVCAQHPVHPAHLIDRSLVPDPDGDARRVVPLCPTHHREYDDFGLSILEHLEPRYRVELAYAVELVGLITALERITNERWIPEPPRTEGARA